MIYLQELTKSKTTLQIRMHTEEEKGKNKFLANFIICWKKQKRAFPNPPPKKTHKDKTEGVYKTLLYG